MSTLLVTNDDGVESPALIPLIRALDALDRVRAVNTIVPDRERSWISKAVSRFSEIEVAERKGEPDDPRIVTTSGTPADCANLGIHPVFEAKPDLVVSGINVGLNHGLAFLSSSGTVGAAAEGVIAGLPAVAISIGVQGGHGRFVSHAHSEDAAVLWQRASEVAAEIVGAVLEHGLPDGVDLLNVNLPENVDRDTPRVITELARVGYDALFSRQPNGRFAYDYQGLIERRATEGPNDHRVLRDGHVSITPLALPHAADFDGPLRSALEVPGK
ncbi:MAG: 5'/3'-nucleotidase SurE [Myxococcota bacterium]|jgi:5'-nucleotidase|nr:5'/3'-nucleotidase SurE [Myxococcota bacterium]